MKKSGLTIALVSLLSLPLVAADIPTTLGNVWQGILRVGDLSFLGYSSGGIFAAFTRILIWILVFTIFFAVMVGFGKGKKTTLGFVNKNQALVIAAVLATMAAAFLPPEILLATGSAWAIAVSFILIGGPIVGIAFLLWKIPWEGDETRWTVFVKLMLCLLLFWILTVMKNHVAGLA